MNRLIDEAILSNPKAVEQFKDGKDKALNAIVGYVLKQQPNLKPENVIDQIRLKLGAPPRVEKEKKTASEPEAPTLRFGILNKVPESRHDEYGETRYWVEHEGKERIEFLVTQIDTIPDLPESFVKYIKRLSITS